MADLVAKRGDTFTLTCTRTDSGGSAVDLTGQTITAQLRRGSSVIDLTATITLAASGQFTLTALPTATDDWTTGRYLCDVQFVDGDDTVSTETFVVSIQRDTTVAS